jgi:hypothetical protein
MCVRIAGRLIVLAGECGVGKTRRPCSDDRSILSSRRATSERRPGNPLLLRALAGSLEREGIEPTKANIGRVLDVGPRAISHLVSERLAHANPEQLRVARAAAVLGAGPD